MSGTTRRSTRSIAASSEASAATRSVPPSSPSARATRRTPSANSLNGAPPGNIVVTNHESEPAASPARTVEKPGAHNARLAAPRSTNDDDEPSAEIVVTQTFDQFVDDALASEEVGCVGFVKGTQTLVRDSSAGWARYPHPRSPRPPRRSRRSTGDRRREGHAALPEPRRVKRSGTVVAQARRGEHGEVASVAVEVGRRAADHEVGQVRGTVFVEEHRLGNDAAVAEPFRGGNFERTADPLYERRRFLVGERTLLQTIAQGAAVHASHDQVRTRRFTPVVVDRNDRIVGNRRERVARPARSCARSRAGRRCRRDTHGSPVLVPHQGVAPRTRCPGDQSRADPRAGTRAADGRPVR